MLEDGVGTDHLKFCCSKPVLSSPVLMNVLRLLVIVVSAIKPKNKQTNKQTKKNTAMFLKIDIESSFVCILLTELKT